MSGSLCSSSGSGNWKPQIYFDPKSDSEVGRDYKINDTELEKKLSKLIDTTEEIRNIWVYKHQLYGWQLTDWLMYHAFVVLETESWWWSLEKNDEGITIQRSKKQKFVKDKYRRNDRHHVKRLHHDEGRMKMEDLVKWLYTNDELNLKYCAMDKETNCKGFAERIFNHFAKEKYCDLVH